MRAVVTSGHGGTEVLAIGEVASPVCGPEQIRIEVTATAVNRADLLQREGRYPPPAGASQIIGLECAGVVTEVGSAVTEWSPGDRVMALLPGGGYAAEAVVDAGSAMRVPSVFSDEEAAAFPEVFLTAYLNLFLLGRLRSGERVLIHGGGSGVGTAATTLARLAGAHVLVTAGSREKCDRCIEHGAHEAIDYRTEDFVARARPVDVVLDHIGAKYLPRNLQALAQDGRIVVIGSMGGERRAELDVVELLGKRAQIIGSTLRNRSAAEKRALVAAFLAQFGTALETGQIRPVVHRTFALDDVAAAHQLMAASEHFGKIVLRL